MSYLITFQAYDEEDNHGIIIGKMFDTEDGELNGKKKVAVYEIDLKPLVKRIEENENGDSFFQTNDLATCISDILENDVIGIVKPKETFIPDYYPRTYMGTPAIYINYKSIVAALK